MMFSNSPISKEVWTYFDEKYGQLIAPIGLLKACSVLSSRFPEYPRLNILNIAPTRQFKSRTSLEQKFIFNGSFWSDVGSDFTIHGIQKEFRGNIKHKCLLINDGTLLLKSKAQRTRDRLINGIAELLSEGMYQYKERQARFILKGKLSVVMNMTLESYLQNKNVLLGATFRERFLTVFYSMPLVEQLDYAEHWEEKNSIRWDKRLSKLVNKNLVNELEYRKAIINKSKDISIKAVQPFLAVYDQIRALLKAHANLNRRDNLCDDDFDFLRSIENYTVDITAPNESRIIQMRKEGRTYKDICLLLGKDEEKYSSYISKVVNKAKSRGILQ